MKRLTFLLSTLLLLGTISAQEESEIIEIKGGEPPREINQFYQGPISHGFSIGLSAHYGQIDGEDAVLFGTTLSYVMDHFLEIGVGGKWFYAEQSQLGFSNDDIVLTGGYGGLHIQPSLFHKERIHLSFPFMLGGGAVGYFDEKLSDIFDYNHDAEDWDVLFVVEPGVNVVFNITRFFKMETGLSYRFTNQVQLDNLEKMRLNGLAVGVSLKFGIL